MIDVVPIAPLAASQFLVRSSLNKNGMRYFELGRTYLSVYFPAD